MEQVAKFQIGDILPIALTICVAAIGIAFALQVQGDVRDDFVTATTGCGLNSTGGTAGTLLYSGCGADYNATVDGLNATAKFTDKLGIIVTVVIAAILIGILTRYLMGMR